MKKFSKLLAVVVAIAVVVCPMMSIVSNATSTGGYKIEALDENNLKLTISSTDGFIAYSASVGFNSASAFQSTYSSDGYTNGLKLIDYTTKTAAKSSYNTPQISANATGSALNIVVMPNDINNLDLLTEVVIGLRVASGTTASLTKIQAADDGAEITEDPTLLSFPAADANTGAIDSTDPAYISSNATTNAHTHSFTQQTQTAAYLRTAATCSANATYWYSCSTCGLASSTNYFTATGTMLAHTPDNTETYVKAAATCTADAQYWQECSVCHQQLSTYWTKPSTALGHNMTYHAATASTCEYQGNDAYYSCSRCGKLFGDNAGANEVTIEDVTRALGDHTASNTKKFLKTAAGCTTDAVYYQECSVCGTQLVSTWTDTGSATGHTPAAAVTENTVAATCSATGSYDSVVYCSVCGAEISRTPNVIAKLAHTVVEDAAVAATCTETGLTAGSHCSVCDEVIVAQTVVPATGHTAVEDAAVPATCTETGLTAGSHCSVCDEVIVAQTVVPATGHTAVEDAAVAATCTETGLTAGSHCSVCGETIVAQTVVPALGHDFTYNSNSNGTHAVGCTRCDYAATEDCDTAGAEGACSKCGYKAAPSHVHEWIVDTIVQPTKTTTGLRTWKCSDPDCHETKEPDVLAIPSLQAGTFLADPDLIVNDVVAASIAVGNKNVINAGYDDYILVVDYYSYQTVDANAYTLTRLSKTFTSSEFARQNAKQTMSYFTFDKIALYEMTLGFEPTVYMISDGVVTGYSSLASTNIASVATAYAAKYSTDVDLLKALADMMYAGEQLQRYFALANPTSDLATAVNNNDLPTVIFADYMENKSSEEELPGTIASFANGTAVTANGFQAMPEVVIRSSNQLMYTLKLPTPATYSPENFTAVIHYTNGYNQEVSKTITTDDMTLSSSKASRNLYTYYFTNLALYDLEKTVTCDLYYDGVLQYTYEYKLSTFINDYISNEAMHDTLASIVLFYQSVQAKLFASTPYYS